ncbi:MAG: phage portal protein [Oscillospiraceae bacterium]
MKVVPSRTISTIKQERSILGSYLVGGADFDSLGVRGYTRIIDSPDVASAVNKLADIVSNTTIHLMRNTENGDVRVKNELSKFMDIHPYSLGTRKSLINWIVCYMLLEDGGNAFVLPVTDGGLLKDLIPMPGATASSIDGGTSYRVLWKGCYFEPNEVLHFVYRPDLMEPWRGRGLQIQLKDVLRNLKQAAATTNSFLSDKWKPSVIVKVDALADEFSGIAGRKKLLDEYVAGQNAGEPWVIPSELMEIEQVKPLSLADLALNDNVQLDKKCVAAAIGVPPFFVGVGNYNQEEYNNTIRTTAKTIVTIIQQELTKKILLSPELYFKFNEWKLYAYNLKELADVGTQLYVRGIDSGNEVRDMIGQSPVKGLDERVILENYIPAGMIGDQKKLIQDGGNSDE